MSEQQEEQASQKSLALPPAATLFSKAFEQQGPTMGLLLVITWMLYSQLQEVAHTVDTLAVEVRVDKYTEKDHDDWVRDNFIPAMDKLQHTIDEQSKQIQELTVQMATLEDRQRRP